MFAGNLGTGFHTRRGDGAFPLGMKRRKIGATPGKALTDDKCKEQERVIEQELAPRLAEAAAGRRRVFLTDAAHFIHEIREEAMLIFQDCVYGANEEHKEKLDSLPTLKFQSFKKVNIMNH